MSHDVNNIIREARRRLPMSQLATMLGVELKPKGNSTHIHIGLCPFHGDREPSLDIDDEKNGGVWTCRAGCGGGDHLEFVARKFDLVGKKGRAISKLCELAGVEEPKPACVATYIYTNVDGESVGIKERWEPAPDGKAPKGFFWHHVDDKGRKAKPAKQPDAARTIYRAHKVANAIEAEETVYVVEGEKCVEALEQIGLVATCNENGAGKWRPHHTERLRGAIAVVIPDNDEAGHKHADDVVRALVQVAASVRRLDLAGLRAKGDVADWIEAGGTREKLQALVANLRRELKAVISCTASNEPIVTWRARLTMKPDGTLRGDVSNVLLVLENSPDLAGVIGFNELAAKTTFRKTPPWFTRSTDLQDADVVRLTAYLQEKHRCAVDVTNVGRAVASAAERWAFDPVREYLSGLKHDGVKRLDSWLTRYLGVHESAYARAVGRKFLIAAVARAFEPGCKVDTCLVLEGRQGRGKSTAAEVLAKGYFTDDVPDLSQQKEAAGALRGAWIVELSELDAMRKADVAKVKAFISRREDRYRPPYGTHAVEFPRRCVFIATTNESTYLADASGGRRFWPVECGEIDVVGLRADVDQLWAEAVEAYRARESWWLEAEEHKEDAEAQQEARLERDPWEAPLAQFLAEAESMSTSEVLSQVGMDLSQRKRADEMRAAAILRKAGFLYRKRVPAKPAGREWRYCRSEFGPTDARGESARRTPVTPHSDATHPTRPTYPTSLKRDQGEEEEEEGARTHRDFAADVDQSDGWGGRTEQPVLPADCGEDIFETEVRR